MMFVEMEQFLPELERLMNAQLLVPPGEGELHDVVGPMAVEHLATGGKRLRARLALAAAKGLGLEAREAIPWAASCELLHNATLIHDDLQDGDRVRRGAPTVWVAHGSVQAINAGDLMWTTPYTSVDELGEGFSAEVKFRLCQVLGRYSASVIRGQAVEYFMTTGGITDIDFYHQAIRGKTSALFELPVVGAAILAGHSQERALRIAEPFTNLGMLFQMQDDVLDLFGDKGRGETGADLREGKISALVVEHLALHPEDAPKLLDLLNTPREQTLDAQVEETIEAFRTGGALAGVLARIEAEAARSLSSDVWEEHPELKEVLQDLVDVILKPIEHVMI
ncbi:MAG: polyprenyl synthetase family protein [Myxococcota bacterium]|nr:polyprenyl synthetase family protein [Myxococcota bacterium]